MKRSLIIELASPEEANRAIEEGIVIGSMLHGCCVYNKQCRSGQCFECWQYGHVSILCPTRGKPTCGRCGGKHHHDDCKETTIKCVVCKGFHVAWSKVCEAKKKDMARMIEARLLTSARYSCGKDHENHQTAEQTIGYFQNATNQLRKETVFPRLQVKQDDSIVRDRIGTPSLKNTVTPKLQGGRTPTATSPTRASARNRSPPKVVREAEDYERDIEAGEINDVKGGRRSLSQLNNNERIAISASQNRAKRYIQSLQDVENASGGLDWADKVNQNAINDSQC